MTSNVTVTVYIERYIERVSYQWKPSTVDTYVEQLRQNISPFVGEKQMKDFKKSDFDALLTILINKKRLSTGRINTVVGLLNQAFKDAFANEVIRRPLQFDRLKRTEKKKKKRVPFTYEEVEAVLKFVPDFYRPVLTFIAYTGVRPNEALGLKWDDVDLNNSKVTIERGIVDGIEGSTKTGIVRDIPLVPKLRKVLRRLENSSEYVFHRGGKPLEGHLDRIWRDATAAAGVKHRCLYTLRHSFLSNALQRGVSINYVSKLAGHSSIQTTLVHYADYVDTGSIEPKKLLEAFK